MFTSIKAKIIVFYTAVLFSILAALGGFLYLSLDRIVYRAIDSSLLSKAKTLTTLIDTDAEDTTEFRRSDEVRWEYGSPESTSFFQIRRADGSTLEKSASLQGAGLPAPAKDRARFTTVRVNGVLARLVDFPLPAGTGPAAPGKGQGLVIQCAQDIGKEAEILRQYRLVLSFSILALLVVSASGGFLIAKKALAPVKDISDTIDRISESNLSERIKPGLVPGELKVLASSFNRTFDRLEAAFGRQLRFTADASHELRTPLAVIMSQSEITLRKDRTAREYREVLAAIGKAAEMMSGTVHKLLAIARLDADKAALRHEDLLPAEIIGEAVRLLAPLADRSGVVVTAPAASGVRVRGDRAALLELFVNLIDNAVKYNVRGGKVDISLREEDGFVVATISDTGIGIPEADVDKVFDRFYRVDKSRSKERDGAGAGLGLSICGEIAKLHGGRIEIKSGPGTGTAVSVYLKGSGNRQPPRIITVRS